MSARSNRLAGAFCKIFEPYLQLMRVHVVDPEVGRNLLIRRRLVRPFHSTDQGGRPRRPSSALAKR